MECAFIHLCESAVEKANKILGKNIKLRILIDSGFL